MDQAAKSGREKCPRWKLLIWMGVILVLLWFGVRNIPAVQENGSAGAVDLLFVALVIGAGLVWLLFLSRLKWIYRISGLALVCAVAGLVKIDGHTGSFFPQFSWRWSINPATEVPELTGKMAEEGKIIETKGAKNFPRLLGREMKNWVSGELLPERWYEKEPKELWRIEMGEGWSAFSVAGGFAYTMEQRGEIEATICYELGSGKAVWIHEEDVRFEEPMGGDGPRSTPTVIDGKVLSLGATGILNCLDARSGKVIWRVDLLDEFDQNVPQWAKSCSPLVVDGKVVVTLGSKAEKNLAALDLKTGNLIWRSGDYKSSYASPVVGTLAGKRQIIAIQQESVDGYEIETGEILWSFPIDNRQSNCASPLIVDDSVITSSGYGYGTHRIKIRKGDDGFEAEEIWHSRKLKAKFADILVKDGYLFGLDEGRLVCLDLEDGGLAWKGGNFGHGQILGVGEHMIVQSERGGISVVELSSSDEKITVEFDALDHRTWNHPVLAGRVLLLRNDREAIALEY